MIEISNTNHPDKTLLKIIVARRAVGFGSTGSIDCDGDIVANNLIASVLNRLHLWLRWLSGQVDIVHTTFCSHAPTESPEVFVSVHDGREQVLTGMLLHMVPPTVEVNILANCGTRNQGLSHVIDTFKSLTLDTSDRDWFRGRRRQWYDRTIVAGLTAT